MNKQYLKTERAHFMCPNMHFGNLFEMKECYDEDKLNETLLVLANAHPFLRAVLAYEKDSDDIFYNITDTSKIILSIRQNANTIWDDYNAISTTPWDIFSTGLLKVFIYPEENGMSILLVAHHLLADGEGLLNLSSEFANYYSKGIKPNYSEEHLLNSIDELPKGSALSGISKMLVNRANKQWKKENHKVTFEQYSKFAINFCKTHPVKHNTYHTEKDELQDMKNLCHTNNFSINDLLLAKMALKTGAKKIIIAADIRNDLKNYVPGSLGNYASAMGINIKSKANELVALAKDIHLSVQKALTTPKVKMLVLACYFQMDKTLLDAAAISALNGFQSKAAKFVGQGMFNMGNPSSYSITNLGVLENDAIKSIYFIPPASPAAKYTLGVVTLNGVLRACSSEY